MKNRRILPVIVFFFLGIFRLFGFNFSNLILSNDDRLLFKAEFENQHEVFISRLTDMSIQQLTAFPERLSVVNNGRTILVQNHFGLARIPTTGGIPSQVAGFPSFASGNVPLKGRLHEFAASSDGKWLLYVEPVSPAFGTLILVNIESGAKKVISEKIELPNTGFPACWNPDSKLFVYSKNGKLFYYPILNDITVTTDERFRHIGPGEINSVSWGQMGEFYYFNGNILYRVLSPELFTRSIYGDFLTIGNVAAVLPFDFEAGFDRYWVAPNSGSVLINKKGKSLFLFLLGENQYNNSALPHIMLPQGSGNISVFWPSSGVLTIVSSLKKEISVWRFEINGKNVRTLTPTDIPMSNNGAISPDGTKVIFWGEKGLELWDYSNWRLIHKLSETPVLSCAWINNREFVTGNASYIEAVSVANVASATGVASVDYPRRKICLSGADEFGFEDNEHNQRIFARIENDWFASNGRSAWAPATESAMRNTSTASERFRVFLEPQPNGPFTNIPMVRNITSVGTSSLVSNHSINAAYKQGRNIRVALCFDLYDDDTGLSQVLSALRRFNVRATFFLNGDFIRRNPNAAAAIVAAGQEAASLFYAPVDLSDARYTVTPQFIAQGLARNEDEFFQATGKELALLWHPPFFRSSNMINSAAAAVGYATASRDIDPNDWLSRDEALRLGIRQYSSSQLIEQITDKRKNGSIIPIRLGINPGGRDDYLYLKIDVLLDALIRSGCDIVPVSVIVRK
ncbi:polysaccharide deacetylase family protein [Treponema sp. R6D11]